MDTWITRGFWAAAAYNIVGIAVFSKGLTNQVMFDTDPAMFSQPASGLVMVWGLAYLAQSRSWRVAPAMSAVFAIEKAVYVGWWLVWLARHAAELPTIAAQDRLAGAFYAVYGAGDFAFLLLFVAAASRAKEQRQPS